MKTNFTSFAKIILTIVFFTTVSAACAHNANPAVTTGTSGDLTVAVVNNNLVMNWSLPAGADVNYCEIQGSKDGKTFTTIGYVMGPDPVKDATSYIFKQTLSKIKPGKIYFRVLIIGANEKAVSSEVVKLGN